MIEDYSFDEAKFESFLRGLRVTVAEVIESKDRKDKGEETIYLFLDKSVVHKSCVDEMEKLNIEPIWNVPYKY